MMKNKMDSILESLGYNRSFWGTDSKEAYGMSWKINESGLSRIKRHSENGFFTISAFRDKYTFKENVARHKQMKNDIKSKGLGFIELLGGWVERDEETGEDRAVEEFSLFVPYKSGFDKKEFAKFARELSDKYEQEGYIYCDPDDKEITLYDRGDITKGGSYKASRKGPFKVDKMAEYYSKLRKGGQKNIKYAFEGVRVPSGHISAMAMSSEGYILLT